MPGSVRVTQDIIEAILAAGANARVSQDVVEAIVAFDGGRAFGAVNGTALSFPGADTNSDTNVSGVTRCNRLSGFFYPKPGSTVVIHVATGMNDGGNIGIIAVDGTDNQFQTPAAGGGTNTFTVSASASKAYFVYSWNGSAYRAGLTGSMTYDKTVLGEPTGAAVTQDVIEAIVAVGGKVRVTQDVIEAIIATDPGIASSSGGKHGSVSFG